MAASQYCSVSDLFSYGFQPGSIPNPARQVYSVVPGSDVLVADNHGLSDGDAVTFRVDSIGGSLPSPLVAGTTYYVTRITDSRFAVSATSGGALIDLTTAGENALVATEINYLAAIVFASELINNSLPGHIVPIDESAIPEIVRMTAAELAVGKLMSKYGASPTTLSASVDAAQKRLERWAKGVPVRGVNSPPRAQLSRSATAPYADLKGWRTDTTI